MYKRNIVRRKKDTINFGLAKWRTEKREEDTIDRLLYNEITSGEELP